MTDYLTNRLRYTDFAPSAYAHGSMQKTKTTTKKQDEQINKTLQGVILNTYIKDNGKKRTEMDEIANSLIIPDAFEAHPVLKNAPDEKIENEKIKKNSLVRNALPYAASAILATGMALAVSRSYLKSQKLLAPGNVPSGVKLPTVGKNINLKSEEYFAIYMAISEPKSRNILALIGVLTMSALTFIGKTVIDGAKNVWLKKQEADVKKNFEENVIDIETKSFAGKLDVVREELIEKTKYFKEKLDIAPSIEDEQIRGRILNSDLNPVFGRFLSFKGNEIKPVKKANEPENFYDKLKNSPLGLIALCTATLGVMFLGGRKVFKNISEGARIKEEALKRSRQTIRNSIDGLIEEIKASTDSSKKDELTAKIKEKLLSLGADFDEIQSVFKKAGFEKETVQNLSDEVNNAVVKMNLGEKFYVQADPAMGGKEGTQFYIYINQAKGYIYDVITHPENKFARYLFSAITATGAAGYIAKESIDAMKESAVMKENSNTELELQNRLVNTEVRNFKSKKQSAIEPMMIEFDTKFKEGRSKEELKVMAENILLEIKNGPPFVYA